VGKFKNVFGGNTSSGDKIHLNITVKVTAETFHLSFVFWSNLDHQMGSLVPHKSDSEFLSFDKYPETGESELESRVSVSGDWRTSNNVDASITGLEGDGFGTDGTLRTASFVSSGNFKLAFNLGVNVLALSLESVSLAVKGLDMRVTIRFASTSTGISGALPVSDDTASTLVAVHHESFTGSVRSATVITWALFGDDALSGFFFKNISVHALAARFTVVVKVWVDGLISVHVKASGLDWSEALYEFHVTAAGLVLIFTDLVGTLPVTLVALANVAVMSSALTGKVFSAVVETTALGLSDALSFVVENMVVWALTAWDAGLGAFYFIAVFKSSTGSEASLATLFEDLAT
jgi:hypothetical protein